MKSKVYILSLLFIAILFFSCEKSNLEFEDEFKKSY